ncbi:hypothetical protein [Chryseobacterium sp. 22458]|uniref:hypothetical protein n=1 Tax=Chryseobacterium sp. 22458 TaxID=3453921 RepID=UPI003F85146D
MYFAFYLLPLLFFSCHKSQSTEEIGQEIIIENINYFISNLYGLPKNEKEFSSITVQKKIGAKNFINDHCESIVEIEGFNIVENCKNDYFELINKQGFNINKQSKYLSFNIESITNNLQNENLELINSDDKIKYSSYIEVSFSNFYIDEKKGKAFIIVQESESVD